MKDWKSTLSAIKARVQAKRRLTLREGAALLAEYECLMKRVEELEKQKRELEWQHASDTEWLERRIKEWNELVTTLDQILGIKIYGDTSGPDGSLWWRSERDGKRGEPQPSVADVYALVLKERFQQ
jgi:hypothetical protein